MDEKTSRRVPPHPERKSQYPQPLSSEALAAVFAGCADFVSRGALPGLYEGECVTLCWLDGLVDGEAVSEDVLRPLTDLTRGLSARSPGELARLLELGAAYSCTVRRLGDLDGAAAALLSGCCLVCIDALGEAVAFEARSKQVRAVGQPTVEKAIKGGKDAFVETLRANTALVRRRLRTPKLKLEQRGVGRLSDTAVAILYVEGVAQRTTVDEALRRVEAIDIDALLSAGDLEEYVVDSPRSPLPQLLHTERPDTFAMGLLDGRVGLLVDGLPLGFLLPADLAAFMRVPEDAAAHFAVASMLTLLRWAALGISLLLPGAFVAVSMYHQEMLPVELLLSMTAAKQFVPFGTAGEVIAMLLAFELLQEAGLRLPDPVGQTASIIGALIVGQSAVEAKVVSPIAVIVVALAGICGYTMPSQDLGGAVRLFRLGFVALGALLGLYGVISALALLVWYLAGLESFGKPYTAPFTGAERGALVRVLLKRPNAANKLRAAHLAGPNRRRQR